MTGGVQGASGPSLARVFFSAFHAWSFAVARRRLLGMGGQKGGMEIVTQSKSSVLGLSEMFAMGDVLTFLRWRKLDGGGQKGRECSQKVCFSSESMCFYILCCIKSMSLTPLLANICFTNATHVLIMFWHDFGRGGGARPDHRVCKRSDGVVACFLWLILLNKKYKEKKYCLII